MKNSLLTEYHPTCTWPEDYIPELIGCRGTFHEDPNYCMRCPFEAGKAALELVAPFFTWWLEQTRMLSLRFPWSVPQEEVEQLVS